MRNTAVIFAIFILLFASCKSSQKATASAKTSTKKERKTVAAVGPKLDKATQEKMDRLFMDAEKAKVIEDWDNAIQTYNQVLAIDPYNADVHFELSQIYIAQNKLDQAETEDMIAVKIDNANKWYLEELAGIFMNEGKIKEATDVFKILVDKFPTNPDYYLNLGYLYSKQSQFDLAIKTYDLFEKNFGIDENVIQEKKNLYLHLNKFNEAANEVHKLTDAFPGETEYMLMEADLYRANKMNDKAIEIYKKILVIEPDNAQALLSLAELGTQGSGEGQESLKKIFANPKVDIDTKVKILYPYLQYWDLKKDNKQEAFDLAEILTKTHPDQAKGYAIKADLYYLDNQNDLALESYLKALQYNKDVYTVWQQVMVIYNLKKNWDSLERICNEAVELFPNEANIYLFKGGAEYQNKEYEKAIKSFSKGEKMSGDDDKKRAQFLANLGDTYHSINKYDESDSAYEKSLKLDPENAFVLNNYSYYLSVRKVNLEKAKEMSAYANKIEPDNNSFLDTYAWILFQLGDFAGAKEWQEKAIKAGGDKSGTILEHYGDILFKLGNKDEAIENWKKAKEVGTDSSTIDRKIAEQKYVE
jgi:tetratricopeptide (TPR) repeat protein